MDKILQILLVLLFSLTIISCGSDDGGSSASTDNTSSTISISSDYNSITSYTVVFSTSLFVPSYFGV